MRRNAGWVWVVLGLGAAGAWGQQKPVALKNVTVTVVDAHVDPAVPVAAVRVSLAYVDGSHLTTDARDTTNPRGQAFLKVSADTAERDDLRLVVEGNPKLVVFEPADGQLHGLGSTVPVKLLPQGSLKLLGEAQIEAMLHRSLLQVSSLEHQNLALKTSLISSQTAGSPQNALDSALKEWAKANGFAATDVDQRVRQWAEEIQKQSQRATTQQMALAELALKHYSAAAKLFGSAADADAASLDADDQAIMVSRRTKLSQLIKDSKQQASALQLALNYHDATHTLELASNRAATYMKQYPDDPVFRDFWVQSMFSAASARRLEGSVAPADSAVRLLAQAGDELRVVAENFNHSGDRVRWAATEMALGDALSDEGERAESDKAAALLEGAAAAYRHALEVYTRSDQPLNWARAQTRLSQTLTDQATRTSGTRATQLLAEAVLNDRSALEVYTRAANPNEWASAQYCLGSALLAEGLHAGRDTFASLLKESEQAYESALTVYTQTDSPTYWAGAQHNLAGVLQEQANRSTGSAAISLYGRAIESYKKALEVYVADRLPQDRARTEHNLANTLWNESNHTSGAESSDLLDQALDVYRDALKYYNKEDLPQDWASLQSDFANALGDKGYALRGEAAIPYFDQAVEAYNKALEVRTERNLPQDWAQTQLNLGAVLDNEGDKLAGERAAAVYDQAIQALQSALRVFTKAEFPQDWASVQYDLGNTYHDEVRVKPEKAAALLQLAEASQLHALEIYTRETFPKDWSYSRQNLAGVYRDEQKWAEAADDYEQLLPAHSNFAPFYSNLGSIYHEKLFRFDRAVEVDKRLMVLQPTPGHYLNLMEAELTAGQFEDCREMAEQSERLKLSAGETVVRDLLGVACAWVTGQKSEAQSMFATLRSESSSTTRDAWGFAGTLHFLADSPAFDKRRKAWVALFTAVQDGDAAGMTKALDELEPLLQ